MLHNNPGRQKTTTIVSAEGEFCQPKPGPPRGIRSVDLSNGRDVGPESADRRQAAPLPAGLGQRQLASRIGYGRSVRPPK